MEARKNSPLHLPPSYPQQTQAAKNNDGEENEAEGS